MRREKVDSSKIVSRIDRREAAVQVSVSIKEGERAAIVLCHEIIPAASTGFRVWTTPAAGYFEDGFCLI
jgi:hypothetical protein